MTISRGLAKAGVGHPCNELPGSHGKMKTRAVYLFVREKKPPGVELCVRCAVTCVKKVCVFDCFCVSLAGDPALIASGRGPGRLEWEGDSFRLPFSIFRMSNHVDIGCLLKSK